MITPEKRQLWRMLRHEAATNSTCIVCTEPIVQAAPNVSVRRRIKCDNKQCLRGYAAMYRRLWRRDERLAK